MTFLFFCFDLNVRENIMFDIFGDEIFVCLLKSFSYWFKPTLVFIFRPSVELNNSEDNEQKRINIQDFNYKECVKECVTKMTINFDR